MGAEIITTDAVEQIAGPDWLRRRRAAAVAPAAQIDPPTTDSEEWRYSRIGQLELDRYSLVEPTGQSTSSRIARSSRGMSEPIGAYMNSDTPLAAASQSR